MSEKIKWYWLGFILMMNGLAVLSHRDYFSSTALKVDPNYSVDQRVVMPQMLIIRSDIFCFVFFYFVINLFSLRFL